MKNLADNGGTVKGLSTQQPRTGNAMNVNSINRHGRLACHSRVVVTGLGAVTPMAVGVEPSWAAVCRGKSCIRRVTRFDTPHLRTGIAGEVHGFDKSIREESL